MISNKVNAILIIFEIQLFLLFLSYPLQWKEKSQLSKSVFCIAKYINIPEAYLDSLI